MKAHTKIYMDYFAYSKGDWMPCEICYLTMVDIHHIEARGMGGDPQGKKDVIENLMGLCRHCHNFYGDKKQHKEYLKKVHLDFMITSPNYKRNEKI